MAKIEKPKGMSAYEFIYGQPKPKMNSELLPAELNEIQRELDLETGIRYFKVLMEDQTIQSDDVFPKYVYPGVMPSLYGSSTLKDATAVWRAIRLSGGIPTYNDIRERIRKPDEYALEEINELIDEAKGLTLTKDESERTASRLKELMLKEKVSDIAKNNPELLLTSGVDVRNKASLRSFTSNYERMEHFFRHLDETKDIVERVSKSIDNNKNTYDYEL